MLKLLIFHTLCRRDFSKLKHRFNLCESCQVHHIIPREYSEHPLVQKIDIHNGFNLMLLPNKKGKINIRTNRPVHDGGHMKYNRHIGEILDDMTDNDDITCLIRKLRQRIRNRDVPWT